MSIDLDLHNFVVISIKKWGRNSFNPFIIERWDNTGPSTLGNCFEGQGDRIIVCNFVLLNKEGGRVLSMIFFFLNHTIRVSSTLVPFTRLAGGFHKDKPEDCGRLRKTGVVAGIESPATSWWDSGRMSDGGVDPPPPPPPNAGGLTALDNSQKNRPLLLGLVLVLVFSNINQAISIQLILNRKSHHQSHFNVY